MANSDLLKQDRQTDFFDDHVAPILKTHCIRCHGPQKQRGGLRLDSLRATLKGGESGPALVPHKPAQSLLIDALQHGEMFQMPPSGKLPEEQIKTLTAWVAMGAPWSSRTNASVERASTASAKEEPLWSLTAVKKVSPPGVQNRSWPISPVDAFILAALEEKKLTPAAPADKATLIRRVTFDLIGLPPTPDEIKAFVADESPDAFAKLVDRLLESPHYGEHWARHWLDQACYAETNNGESKLNAFRYRDYVINAFNEDLPYQRFIMEQLAGDLLPDARRTAQGLNQSAIGAGFLWMPEMPVKRCDTFDIEVARADHVADQLDMIGKAFLGLTVGCARCHAHKFDPISQEDYYALAGFLRSTRMLQAPVTAPLPGSQSTQAWDKSAALQRDIAGVRARGGNVAKVLESIDQYLLAAAALRCDCGLTPPAGRIEAQAKEHSLDPELLGRWFEYLTRPGMAFDPVFGLWVKMMAVPADRFTVRVKEAIAQSQSGQTWTDAAANRLILRGADSADSLSALAKRYQATLVEALAAWQQSTLPAGDDGERLIAHLLRKNSPIGSALKDEQSSPSELATLRKQRWQNARIIDEICSYTLTSADADPEDARLHIRGNCKNPGPVVPRGLLKVLTKVAPAPTLQGSGRLYFAQQIADADNPLTARVFVNRCWQHHFGAGLVRTPDNFGRVGERPTHPELLDYLAVKFVESGWSIKAMHRLMLLSRTYQMSSSGSAEALTADPDNKLLQHMPIRRLAAEEVRDALLVAAGMLDSKRGGPSVPSVSAGAALDGEWRRSIYLNVRRGAVAPMLLAFDFPNPNLSIGRRHVSIVPGQALVLMNSELVHRVAESWGERLAASEQPDLAHVDHLFWHALGRAPTHEERTSALAFVQDQKSQPKSSAPGRMQAWGDLAHCLFNTNAFLFVR